MSTQSSLVFIPKNSSSIGYNDKTRVHWYIPNEQGTTSAGKYQHMISVRHEHENEVRHRKAELLDLGVISCSSSSPYPDAPEVLVETEDSSAWRRHKIWRSGPNLVYYNMAKSKTNPDKRWYGSYAEFIALPDSYDTGIVDLRSYYHIQAAPDNPDGFSLLDAAVVKKFRLNNSLQYLYFRRDATITRFSFEGGVGASIFDALDSSHQIPDGALSQCFRSATDGLRITAGNVANAIDVISLAKDLYSAGPFGFAKHIKRNTKALDLGARLAPEIIEEIARRCPKLAADKLLTNSWTRKISDSWLWYRYAYSTTKMDMEEIHKKCRSLSIEKSGPHTIRSGMTLPTGTLRCKACITKHDADPASELALRLYEYGLQIDGYAVWDLVPGSFVVDWFSDIGSKLEDKSQDFIRPSAMFSVSPVLFSWKYTETILYNGVRVKCTSYSRWLSDPPSFEYYDEDPSTGTVIRRFFDGIALTVGGYNHYRRP